ncbi:hypothetical protein H0H87_010752 [Tephrocybe sp. NHM501043]|nr:hypothetical protein H0H87_010752 [Tephrocybe sp. NHM501043]
MIIESVPLPSTGLAVSCFADEAVRKSARFQIDRDITTLTQSILALKTKYNSLSTIARLPPEVLAGIFTWNLSMQRRHRNSRWIRVASVCSWWRRVALDCPQLWSFIRNTNVNWITQVVLPRSGNVPLYARFTQARDETFDVFRPALEQMHRFCEIDLCDDTYNQGMQQLLNNLINPSPMLRHLKVTALRSQSMHQLPDNLFGAMAPNLRTLKLQSCTIPTTCPLISGLTKLVLVKLDSDRLPAPQLLALLNRATNLEKLKLEDVCRTSDDNEDDSIHLSLPSNSLIHLNDLVIKSRSPQGLSFMHLLLLLAAAPNLEVLTLETACRFDFDGDEGFTPVPSTHPIELLRLKQIEITSHMPGFITILSSIEGPAITDMNIDTYLPRWLDDSMDQILLDAVGAAIARYLVSITRLQLEHYGSRYVLDSNGSRRIGSAEVPVHLALKDFRYYELEIFLKAIPFDDVEYVGMDLLVDDWIKDLGRLPNLKSIDVRGSASNLVETLGWGISMRDLLDPGPEDINLEKPHIVTPVVHLPLLFSALRSLTFKSWNSRSPSFNIHLLASILQTRKTRGSALEQLTVTSCSHCSSPVIQDISEIRKVVTSVQWDIDAEVSDPGARTALQIKDVPQPHKIPDDGGAILGGS